MSTPKAGAAARGPETPEEFARNVRKSLLKGFALPVLLLIFFAAAPSWLDRKLHGEIQNSILASNDIAAKDRTPLLEIYDRLDLRAVCRAPTPQWQRLHDRFVETGICGQFERLRWSLWVSAALVALLVVATSSVWVLNRRARGSHDALIRAYRQAWRICTTTALAKVFLLIPLLAYGIFELTTLSTGRYYVQVIAAIVIGGLVALWRASGILLKKVPLEFEEPMARAITPAESPELWQAVREAAARLQTAPPDHILIGMQLNFYVTELTVKSGAGRTEGRTLYLSQPLLRQLAPDEVLGIIGHELGHFRGEDTRITREFYPLRFKAQGTMAALASSGWVGWTSVHALLFFHWSFGATEQAMSRERELLADRTGADLTSREVMGRALMKVQVMTEAFNLSLVERDIGSGQNPLEVPFVSLIRERLVPRTEFWTRLFEQKAPHPLDSHPALRVRLEALGEPVDVARAIAVATTETETAYARWFAGRDEIFTAITQEAQARISRVRTQAQTTQADYASEEGRRLLDQNFPEVRWSTRPFLHWLMAGLWIIGAGGFSFVVAIVPDPLAKAALLLPVVGCLAGAVAIWRRHRGGEWILRADGLRYSGWRHPLLFEDVKSMSALKHNGALQVTFALKQRQPWIWKYSPLWWFRQRGVTVGLSLMKEKQQKVLETLHRYLTRQLAA